jgi:type I restriction enzyme S subunit
MSFPSYPSYKDSGVEWLPSIPTSWETRPLKSIASSPGTLFIDGDWIESKDISASGIRYLTSGNVGEGFYKEQGQGFISENTFESLKCVEVFPGDILISRLNLPIGRACIVPNLDSKIVTCVDNVIVRTNEDFDRRYIVYMLTSKAHLENMENLGRGATMPRVSRSVLGSVKFVFPSIHEQAAIADFLDRETVKIDGLIAEQEKLIELLKEKRKAVISQAVTKGLNPDASMKDSGIEWLGQVPEHWEVRRVKYLTSRISSGKTPSGGSEFYVDEGIAFLRSQNVHDDGLHLEDVVFITDAVDQAMSVSRVREHDILLNITGASIGRSCVVPASFQPANVNQHVCVIRLKALSQVRFVGWVFKAATIKNQIDQAQNGAAREGLNFEQIGAMALALPPIREQTAIADFLDRETGKIDDLLVETQKTITLLQERRSALISAAVTGQIDVRTQLQN